MTTTTSTTASAAALLHQLCASLSGKCMLPAVCSSSSLHCSHRLFRVIKPTTTTTTATATTTIKKYNDDDSGRGSGADSDSHLQFLNCWLILLPSPCCNCNDKFVFSVLFWSLDSRAPLPISRSLSSLSLPPSLTTRDAVLCWVAACAASALLCLLDNFCQRRRCRRQRTPFIIY